MELRTFFALLTTIWTAQATVYFKEEFAEGDWKSRWISSTSKGDEQGVFELSHGDFFGDAEKDLGLQTSQDARFYGISTKFPAFSNEGKTLVIQFSVKHQQDIDCGGGYVKVFGSDLEPSELKGDSPYHIMFGPDICGTDKRIHVIFNYKGNTHLLKKEIDPKTDVFTHVYTLVVEPDDTYMVKKDGEVVQQGSLEDWVKDPEIPDPDDKKPEDWDKPQEGRAGDKEAQEKVALGEEPAQELTMAQEGRAGDKEAVFASRRERKKKAQKKVALEELNSSIMTLKQFIEEKKALEQELEELEQDLIKLGRLLKLLGVAVAAYCLLELSNHLG